MGTTVGTFMLQRLAEWGVERIYGYPGDGINGHPRRASTRSSDGSSSSRSATRRSPSFAACAHAKFTGEVGVCMATSGPGAIHLLNGLYDAKLDHQPVVAIVGQQARMSLGADYQQEVDLDALYKDVAAEFVQTCMVPDAGAAPVDRAMRDRQGHALAHLHHRPQRRPGGAPTRSRRASTAPCFSSGAGSSAARVVPPTTTLRARGRGPQRGREGRDADRPGRQARAGARSSRSPTLLGAGVAKALNGRAVLPDDLPYVTGSIGLLGTKPSYDMMEGCDTLLMVGHELPVLRVAARARARRAACRSTSTRG